MASLFWFSFLTATPFPLIRVPALNSTLADLFGVRLLAGPCGLLRLSCGNPKLSRLTPTIPFALKTKCNLARRAGPMCHRHRTFYFTNNVRLERHRARPPLGG